MFYSSYIQIYTLNHFAIIIMLEFFLIRKRHIFPTTCTMVNMQSLFWRSYRTIDNNNNNNNNKRMKEISYKNCYWESNKRGVVVVISADHSLSDLFRFEFNLDSYLTFWLFISSNNSLTVYTYVFNNSYPSLSLALSGNKFRLWKLNLLWINGSSVTFRLRSNQWEFNTWEKSLINK